MRVGLAVLAVAVALFVPSFDDVGPGLDEGIVVAYPTLVQKGQVPGRDFETFYGPGMPYVGAAAFDVFGPHLAVERAIGLVFRLLIVAGIFALLSTWGIPAAVIGSLVTALLLLPLGIPAISWFAALACVLVGLALTDHAIKRDDDGARPNLILGAGLVCGLALVFRPDAAPAAILPATALLIGVGGLRRFLLGFVIGTIPMLVWLAVVGPDQLSRLLSDLAASRSARELPLPPLRDSNAGVLIASITVTLVMLGIALARGVRRQFDRPARRCLVFGILCLTLMPATFQRADAEHILPFGAVALGLTPAGVIELFRPVWRHRIVARLLAAGLVALTVGAFTYASAPTLKGRILLPVSPEPRSYEVGFDGVRSFPTGREADAKALNSLLVQLRARAKPGDRLFVGPVNLAMTNYNDVFVYYLLPDLRPASYYTELNGLAANRRGTSLATDLRRADFLLLTTTYANPAEPSTTAGSDVPEKVVRTFFCRVARQGSYELLRRCLP